MKTYQLACAALIVLASMAASASAAERGGSVSKSALNSMGLAGMQSMSDNDGLAVRGKGTAVAVWGSSTANFFGGQTATNSYLGAASHRFSGSVAAGGSTSFAGVGLNLNGASFFLGGVSGGGAFAVAR